MHKFLEYLLYEDIGRGDLFSQVFNEIPNSDNKLVNARVIAKQSGIFSGEKYIYKLCKLHDINVTLIKRDKDSFLSQDILLELHGKYLEILKIERILLNLMQHSSGIATLTNKYVNALSGYKTYLLDTRKTRPLLRELEKYSVRNGGARNHRMGLDSMLMLKDTHLSHINDICEFVRFARECLPFGTSIEIECQNLSDIENSLRAGADIIMCDNMGIDMIKESISLRDSISPNTIMEASGNINLNNIVDYAKTGVDAISCGSIIHQATWLDLSMKIQQ